MQKTHYLPLAALLGTLLTACDSNDLQVFTPTPDATNFNVLEGTASKGLIAGGRVTVVDADGSTLLASATTDSTGAYSISFTPEQVAAGINTPLQVVVSSDGTATSVCDADNDATGDDDCFTGFSADSTPQYAAFGETFALGADFEMRAVLSDLPPATAAGASITVNPTPLTDIAAGIALGAGTTLTASDVDAANDQVLALLGEITGVDVSDAELTAIAVVDLSDGEAVGIASQISVAAASLSAAVIGLVDPDDESVDSLAEALTGLTTDVVARVQATGNTAAIPATVVEALSANVSVVLTAVAAAGDDVDVADLISASSDLASSLSGVTDDVDAVVSADGSRIDFGDFIPDDMAAGSDDEATVAATVNDSLVGEFSLVYNDFSDDNDSDPFDDGESVTVSISADGELTIGELTLTGPFSRLLGGTVNPAEISWRDDTGGIEYALSNNESGTFNEINVGEAGATLADFPSFLGQLSLPDDDDNGDGGDSAGDGDVTGATAACGENDDNSVTGAQLLANCAGTYTVDSTADGEHDRGTITIAADGSVDFDTDVQLTDTPTVFDRLFIEDEPRIQANYGADDDGPVIQLFFSPETGELVQISYRFRTENIEVIANVSEAS